MRFILAGRFTTLDEHPPKAHPRFLEWTPSRLIEWARKTGPQCGQIVARILDSKPHPEQGFRSCLGITRLGKAVGPERLEAACARALPVDLISIGTRNGQRDVAVSHSFYWINRQTGALVTGKRLLRHGKRVG